MVADNLVNSSEESLRRVEKITGKKVPFVKTELCDEAQVEALFAQYPDIDAAYHMNKRHWNSVRLDGDLPAASSGRWYATPTCWSSAACPPAKRTADKAIHRSGKRTEPITTATVIPPPLHRRNFPALSADLHSRIEPEAAHSPARNTDRPSPPAGIILPQDAEAATPQSTDGSVYFHPAGKFHEFRDGKRFGTACKPRMFRSPNRRIRLQGFSASCAAARRPPSLPGRTAPHRIRAPGFRCGAGG